MRWPDELPGQQWSTGSSAAYLKDLALYWRDGFHWRRHDEASNGSRQCRCHCAPDWTRLGPRDWLTDGQDEREALILRNVKGARIDGDPDDWAAVALLGGQAALNGRLTVSTAPRVEQWWSFDDYVRSQ